MRFDYICFVIHLVNVNDDRRILYWMVDSGLRNCLYLWCRCVLTCFCIVDLGRKNNYAFTLDYAIDIY